MQIEDKEAHHWLVDLIQANWDQYLSLWYRCNGMVHGIDYVEARHKELQTLRQKVTQEYGLYEADPFIISRAQSHLFDQKSLSQRLQQDSDSLACWIAHIKKAKRVQQEFSSSSSGQTIFVPTHLLLAHGVMLYVCPSAQTWVSVRLPERIVPQ